MIKRLLRRLAGPPTPQEAGRALAARAQAIRDEARRQAVIDHLMTFEPLGQRGLHILNGETHDVG